MQDLQRIQNSSTTETPPIAVPASVLQRFHQAVSVLRTPSAGQQQEDNTSSPFRTESQLLGLHLVLIAKTLETQFKYCFEAHEHALLENIKAQLSFPEVFNI